MPLMNEYEEKFTLATKNGFFSKLPQNEQEFIKEKAFTFKFSHQELKQIIDIARDLGMWDEKRINEIFPEHSQKKVVFTRLRKAYEEIRSKPNSYKNFELKSEKPEADGQFPFADQHPCQE